MALYYCSVRWLKFCQIFKERYCLHEILELGFIKNLLSLPFVQIKNLFPFGSQNNELDLPVDEMKAEILKDLKIGV